MNLRIFNFFFLCIIFNFFFFWKLGYSQEIKILILPFENLSSEAQAFSRLYPLIVKELKKHGFIIYDERETEKIMEDLEIKERGYVLKSQMERLYKDYGVEYLLTGNIFRFSEEQNPKVSLHARIIKLPERRIVWSGYFGKTGDDYETFFGLGKIRDVMVLAERVLSRLFSDLNSASLIKKGVVKEEKKIALFPFRNLSQEAWVGKLTTYLLLTKLSQQEKFKVLELGEVIELMRKYAILPLAELNFSQLEEVNFELEADYVILGSVDDFWEEGTKTYYPEVVVALRYLETEEKKIIFMDDCHFTGISKEGILERGKLRLADSVAYECVKNFVNKIKALEKGP